MGKKPGRVLGQRNMLPDTGMEEHPASVQRPRGCAGLDRTWPPGTERMQSPTAHINIRGHCGQQAQMLNHKVKI